MLLSANVEGCKILGDGEPVAGVGPQTREGFQVTVGGMGGGGEGRSTDGVVSCGDLFLEGGLGRGRVVTTSEVETVAWSLGGGRMFVTS